MQENRAEVMQKISGLLQGLQLTEQAKFIDSLPQSLLNFLKQKEIAVTELATPIPRYVRLKPGSPVTLSQLAHSLGTPESTVVQVDHQFFALAPHLKISSCPLYRQALLYGMDYSSCIPARCLCAQPGHKILQLCSAPGNKSMYIADTVPGVHITAVEINPNRANVMTNLISKYGLAQRIQVVVADGMGFGDEGTYDRVLVDAQCTHEGSVKHIKKFMAKGEFVGEDLNKGERKKKKNLSRQQQRQFQLNNSNPYTSQILKPNQWSVQDFKQRFLDEKKLSNLQSLQSGLLENGFRLLKQSGMLVYSTCSLDEAQNECVVEKFLAKTPQAQLHDCTQDLKCAVEFGGSRLHGCIRFSPAVSRCGGMFVCRIVKMPSGQIINAQA